MKAEGAKLFCPRTHEMTRKRKRNCSEQDRISSEPAEA